MYSPRNRQAADPAKSRRGPAEWAADVELDESNVRALIGSQFPDVDLGGLAPFATGWDNALWVTGEGIAFRFPRRAIAVAGVEREIALLPEPVRGSCRGARSLTMGSRGRARRSGPLSGDSFARSTSLHCAAP